MIVGFMADPGDSQAEVVRWVADYMKVLTGIEIQDGSLHGEQDLWLVQQTVLHEGKGKILEQAKAHGLPVVILERIDGCQLTVKTRRYINHPNVVTVIKNYDTQPHSCHNQIGVSRRHVHALEWIWGEKAFEKQQMAKLVSDHKQLSGRALRKVVTGFTFGSYKLVREGCWSLPWNDERTIRAGFWGTVDYDREKLLTRHRTSLVDRLNAIEGCVAKSGRPYDRETYIRMMTICKAVVSPWGYGESCYRDYEALLCGAVLIKPETPWISEQSGIYEWAAKAGTIQWCRPDWKRNRLEDLISGPAVVGRLGLLIKRAVNSWRCQSPA